MTVHTARYLWRKSVRRDVVETNTRRLMDAAVQSASSQAAESGWHRVNGPAVTLHDLAPLDEYEVRVEFDVARSDDHERQCVRCGQRPSWGPGARYCRTCVAERDWQANGIETRLACEDLYGTRGGYERHRRVGELPCGPCREASNAAKREHRARKANA